MPDSYLVFKHVGFSVSGKTTEHKVTNLDGIELGMIKFKATWRKYCFYPVANTVYDNNCLKEIMDFIDLQMRQRTPYATT
jgi:hypothetical protein